MTSLAATTWQEAAPFARSGATLLVPVGSTEQHGPHLPLTTDTDIAEAIVSGALGRAPGFVGAPAVAYGSSGEHQEFAGTLSIGTPATELLLVELGRSALHSFGRVVFVSTHGGNADALRRALETLGDAGRGRVEAFTPRLAGDLHAGRTETSLMLAIAPGRVRLDRAEPGRLEGAGTLLPVLRRHGVRAVSDNGVLGDPTGASAEEGRELLGRAVDDLLAFLASGTRDEGAGHVAREPTRNREPTTNREVN